MKLIILTILQSICLCGGQVLLKLAMTRMPAFSWTGKYIIALLTNGSLFACGMAFVAAGVLWMYILRHFSFSQAYPLSALAYVMGMVAAIFIFHESVSLIQWLGVLLIMAGCFLVVR